MYLLYYDVRIIHAVRRSVLLSFRSGANGEQLLRWKLSRCSRQTTELLLPPLPSRLNSNCLRTQRAHAVHRVPPSSSSSSSDAAAAIKQTNENAFRRPTYDSCRRRTRVCIIIHVYHRYALQVVQVHHCRCEYFRHIRASDTRVTRW